MTQIKKYYLIGLMFVLGFGIGVFVDNTFFDKDVASTFRSIRITDPNYKLISPLLLAGISVQGDTEEFKIIENKLKLLTYDALNVPGVDTISLYYKDLTSGLWAGIGENIGYDPASLLKVPIMIAWFKKEQDNPNTFSKTLVWTGSPNDNKNIEFFGLTPGQSYTIEALIRDMVIKSDNDAKNLLLSSLDTKTLDTVFTDLGIKNWNNASGTPNRISPIMYSRFLRVLYNSTYLSRELSEKALELLSESDFKEGLVAGVPADVKVAHKFGQFTYQDPKNTTGIDPVEFHDCGIIYQPKKPYLLCVMTEGRTNLINLQNIIAHISGAVYETVEAEK
jgi:beta-lactamase class A